MKLADAQGWVDVDAMLDSISERQLSEWMALDRIYPITRERNEVVLAIGFMRLCAAMGATYKLESFLPFMTAEKPEMSVESMIAAAKSASSAMGAA